ncbi:MAG: type II secretion system ATPase GspE [Desulfotignum sp.]|jgi:general secretion pathway protein E|nr:type II secretion system ATPase GspE [Desulfotignum sp.]
MIQQFIDILNRDFGFPEKETSKILAAYEQDKTSLVETVLSAKLITEQDVLEILGRIYHMPVLSVMEPDHADDAWTRDISRNFLKKACLVPLIKQTGRSVIAINDPSDLAPADDLAALIGLTDHDLVLARKNRILWAINILYDRSGDSARQLAEDMEDNDLMMDDLEQTADLLDDVSDAPVIRLVNRMISQAVKTGASDIHIEPFQHSLKIRYRIDGIMYERLTPPKNIQASLISRIKVMASMNIAEKRVPQDGRAQVRIGDQEIDIRISTVPTSYGERLVMRLLNKSGYFLSLHQFGLSRDHFDRLNHIIRQNHGIVLVTGPTGSGKTTTLYAALSEINSPDKNIITIEDPVEYNLAGIGQIQVNPKTGVTFAKGLRAIVRQDPDVVLVGEIRDVETAGIAIQSALTGHLVFSTLHTNDAAGAITRLKDLGVEPYLISSSVNAIIAQRLVRILCPHCRQQYVLTPDDVKTLNTNGQDMTGKKVYRPRGCSQCFETGYFRRQAIFEILELDDDIRNLILKTSETNRIREAAIKKGMVTLRSDGMAKVFQGITSIREVFRVTQD